MVLPTTISQEIPKWMKKWSDNSNENVENETFFMIVWMKGGEKMNEQKKSITMKDVAAEAGVSVGTVSRVINNEKGIKEVTLKKSSTSD